MVNPGMVVGNGMEDEERDCQATWGNLSRSMDFSWVRGERICGWRNHGVEETLDLVECCRELVRSAIGGRGSLNYIYCREVA